MTSKMTVGEIVAEFLERCGVTTAFGIISVHNIPMLDAIGRRNRIRFVSPRGEVGASHIADGYARVSGGLGVVFSSTGPAAANAATGLLEARFANSPVLHITGQSATPHLERGHGTAHDVPDQLTMLRSVSKAAYRVKSAEGVLGILVQAATDALTSPQGPVSVEIPIDIQRASVPRPGSLQSLSLPLPAPMPADEAAIDDVAEMVAKAQRPLLWLGSGARHAGPEAERLLQLGFCMVTSWAGRGMVREDHPQSLGSLSTLLSPRVLEFFGTVDLMLVAGSRLKGQQTRDLSTELPRPMIQIDVDPKADGRTYRPDYFVTADSALALGQLADRLEGRLKVQKGYLKEFAAMKAEARSALSDTLGPYRDFADQLRAAVPEDTVFVRDITWHNWTWGHNLFQVNGPRDSVHPVSSGIGCGLPLGVGAAIAAAGRKTVLIAGDGGFFLNHGELWTAIDQGADIVVCVMNDRAYGAIRHIQDALYDGRQFFTELRHPELEGLAKLAGIPFWRVTEAAGFGTAVSEAAAVGGPALVEVDMQAVGPAPGAYRKPPYTEAAEAREREKATP